VGGHLGVLQNFTGTLLRNVEYTLGSSARARSIGTLAE
jgi:hypothetical protein